MTQFSEKAILIQVWFKFLWLVSWRCGSGGNFKMEDNNSLQFFKFSYTSKERVEPYTTIRERQAYRILFAFLAGSSSAFFPNDLKWFNVIWGGWMSFDMTFRGNIIFRNFQSNICEMGLVIHFEVTNMFYNIMVLTVYCDR